MKEKLLLLFLSFFIVACSSSNKPEPGPLTDAELFVRENAAQTTIPLVLNTSWKYRKNLGGSEKPDGYISNLLLNDEIISMKILPVRQYDTNSGKGKYIYQTLCYITSNNNVFFYMDDKILVGRYLTPDSYGLESVIWEFELPASYSETSTGYYKLNRTASLSDPGINKSENFLYEQQGFQTVKVGYAGYERVYENCKCFEYNNVRTSGAEPVKRNLFYFKAGKGLVKYQQIVQIDTNSATTYEQTIDEPLQ